MTSQFDNPRYDLLHEMYKLFVFFPDKGTLTMLQTVNPFFLILVC